LPAGARPRGAEGHFLPLEDAMRTNAKCLPRPFLFAVLVVAAAPVFGTAQRTFVASSGSDAAPCSISQPCRSFTAAVANVSTDGEVIVLDSAGYGPVILAKAVSLIAPPGIYAGISTPFGNGINISGVSAGKIVLRGLTINGQGTGGQGITGGSAELHVESCIISNMTDAGIAVTNLGSKVRITDSTIRSNGASGVVIEGGTLTVENSKFIDNAADGIQAVNEPEVSIRGSTFTGNVHSGLDVVLNFAGTSSSLAVSKSDFSANGIDGIKLDLQSASVFLLIAIDTISAHRNALYGIELIGVQASSNANASISASQIALNGADGIRIISSGVALVPVSQSAINDNGSVGVSVSGGSGVVVGLSNNTIARNGDNDLQQVAPAVVRTFGNNALTGNGSGDVSGSLVTVMPK